MSTTWIEGGWGEKEITEQNLDNIWIWRNSEAPPSDDTISYPVAAQKNTVSQGHPELYSQGEKEELSSSLVGEKRLEKHEVLP